MGTSKKVSALQTTDETPHTSVTLAPDFDGYLFTITMDSSWNETLCPRMRPPLALARRRANATPMSHGPSVFLLIDSGSAVAGCPRGWCPNIFFARNETVALSGWEQDHRAHWREGRAVHHCWTQEHGVQFSSVQCSIPECVCLAQAGCKLEVNDSMAQLRLPEQGTLDLDLIGGTPWLELWDPRSFVHGANTLIFPVSHGNSSGSLLETVSGEGGLVITGSRAGTGETGSLAFRSPNRCLWMTSKLSRMRSKTRVRKERVLPTADHVTKHNATHLPFRDCCVLCIVVKAPDWPHSRIIHSSTAVPMCQLDSFFLNRRGDTDILTALNFLHCPSGGSLVQCCDGLAKPHCASNYDTHGFPGFQEDLFANRWRTCLGGASSTSNQDCSKRRDTAGNNATILEFFAGCC